MQIAFHCTLATVSAPFRKKASARVCVCVCRCNFLLFNLKLLNITLYKQSKSKVCLTVSDEKLLRCYHPLPVHSRTFMCALKAGRGAEMLLAFICSLIFPGASSLPFLSSCFSTKQEKSLNSVRSCFCLFLRKIEIFYLVAEST